MEKQEIYKLYTNNQWNIFFFPFLNKFLNIIYHVYYNLYLMVSVIM